jgi:hypothetical protein
MKVIELKGVNITGEQAAGKTSNGTFYIVPKWYLEAIASYEEILEIKKTNKVIIPNGVFKVIEPVMAKLT